MVAILDFKMADLHVLYILLSGIIRKLDPQNLYQDTKLKIMFLTWILEEILSEIDVLNNHGGHLRFQDGRLILQTSKWYNKKA